MRKGYFHKRIFQVVAADNHRPLSREFKTFEGAANERGRFVNRMSQYIKPEATEIMEVIIYTDKKAIIKKQIDNGK